MREDRKRKTSEVWNEIREVLRKDIPDAQFGFSSGSGGSDGGADIVVEVTGKEMETLEEVTGQVEAAVASVPGLMDVTSTLKTGKPELAVALNRQKLERYHLSMAQVGTLLRTSLTGEVASRYREGDEEYDIRVQLAPDARQIVEDADRILINVGGEAVPLSELGQVSLSEGPTQIVRQNKQRMVTVTANIADGVLGEKLDAIREKIATLELPPDYAVDFGGQVDTMNESFVALFTPLILAIVLTYMLLAAILDSFVHPFTIMITLPLGLVGTSLALFITGTTLNIFSMMAIIMLVGIVVNDAILILVYANQRRQDGMEMMRALLEAGTTRLRPIIMTNIAITAGMLPQALGTSGAAAIRASMAIVTIGAVIISALFTLFVIPVVYTVMDRFAKKPERVEEGIGVDELPAMSVAD
ncbi:efflux RND transporter permease subunit [Candidatus Poribacteria bacterium]|nr:efflux RND transporter permease subunit [Candidatus Poribacteria bacterium]